MGISSNEKIKKIKIQNCLFKTIGFMNCDRSFHDALKENNFVKKNFDSDTVNFLIINISMSLIKFELS